MVLPTNFLALPPLFFLQSLLLSCRFAPVWTPLHILKQPQQNGRLLWPCGSTQVLPSMNTTLRLCVGMTFRAGINSVVSQEALRRAKQLSMESYQISYNQHLENIVTEKQTLSGYRMSHVIQRRTNHSETPQAIRTFKYAIPAIKKNCSRH